MARLPFERGSQVSQRRSTLRCLHSFTKIPGRRNVNLSVVAGM